MLEVILAAVVTKPVMHAYSAPAFGTPVHFLLSPEEGFHAVFLEKFQVFDRARVIIPLVARIYCFKALAWKLGAFKAKGDLLADLGWTLFLNKRAIFVSRAAPRAMLYAFLQGDVAGISKISGTKSAVNATRPNQILIHVYH